MESHANLGIAVLLAASLLLLAVVACAETPPPPPTPEPPAPATLNQEATTAAAYRRREKNSDPDGLWRQHASGRWRHTRVARAYLPAGSSRYLGSLHHSDRPAFRVPSIPEPGRFRQNVTRPRLPL